MRIFIIIMLLFSFNLYSQRCGGTSTSNGRLWDRSIEYLHKTLSESKDRDDNEYMSNKLLISDTGSLIENKYFDISTTKKITDTYVPIGAHSFTVEAGHTFQPGDRVFQQRKPT